MALLLFSLRRSEFNCYSACHKATHKANMTDVNTDTTRRREDRFERGCRDKRSRKNFLRDDPRVRPIYELPSRSNEFEKTLDQGPIESTENRREISVKPNNLVPAKDKVLELVHLIRQLFRPLSYLF